MRSRVINTAIVRDEWFLSLPLEEQRFFIQLLITDRVEMSGVFEYPDRDVLHEMPFLSHQRLQLLKKRFEADGKVYFCDGWMWIANFDRHNYFTSPQQQIAIHKQLTDLERRKPKIIEYFKEKGLIMPDVSDYLEKRRRHKAKKMLRKEKPWLMGQQLEDAVDKLLGVADSGKMDWATLVESGKKSSQYPTPESVYPKIEEVAAQFSIKEWVLYWFFKKKVLKLQASGRSKTDYLALLRESATKIKPLNHTEKVQALTLYANEVKGDQMTADEADLLINMKG